jgi:hypothetical protein
MAAGSRWAGGRFWTIVMDLRVAGSFVAKIGDFSKIPSHYSEGIRRFERADIYKRMLDRIDLEPVFFAPFVSSVMTV